MDGQPMPSPSLHVLGMAGCAVALAAAGVGLMALGAVLHF